LGAKKDRVNSIGIWEKSVDAFRTAISSDASISMVQIPYQKTILPGYLLKSKAANAPLVIIQTGFDGTAEELYFEAGMAAYQRGYNVLLFEGPGQGGVIKKQNLPFRYDWEKVVTPVVDFAMQLDFIDQKKIALIGISLGGYLAARAVAFEYRIAACVLNGGIFDFSENIYQSMPKEVTGMLKGNTTGFNQAIVSEMARSVNINWFFNNAMWTMQVETPAEVMKVLKQYTLQGVAAKIQCPTLVIDSEDDIFLKGQPQKVFDQLKCPKTLLKFSPETTAQAHCQMGALMISNESIFNWLDQTLGWSNTIYQK
jgi:predicted alpha/beta-fold hydrolase